jgi:hypothetical protein
MDLARALLGPAICVAANVLAILIEVGSRAVGDPDQMNPFSLVNGDLHETTDTHSTLQIEEVETGSGWAWPACRVDPCDCTCGKSTPGSRRSQTLAFAKPVNII